MWNDHGDGYGYDMMNGGGVAVMIGVFALVLLGLAMIAVVVSLYFHQRRSPATTPATSSGPEARRLLDRRLALGEITPEEYTSVRAMLDG